ncbi:unnamed protein product [Adineta ricciae]|uniref:Uncharacterized protein n=1 Tax=Adineta ricciae TaxID=249248 RepID=A0A815AAN1_ADIRI|nr:unnamed protein product [Adineta ricciae]
MPKQERFNRYTPENPLPDDVANMSRQDTVCKFCGVSYLVHNEIKALESKCKNLENQLASHTKNSSERDQTRLADLESINALNTHKLNEMSRKLQLLQDQLDQSEKCHEKAKSQIVTYSSSLRTVRNQIQSLRKEYTLLQDSYTKDSQNWKIYLTTTEDTLQNHIQTMLTKYRMENELTQVKHSNKSQSLIQSDLDAARQELQIHQTELSRLREQISDDERIRIELQNQLECAKRYSHELERQISDRDQSGHNTDAILDQYRREATTEKELRLKSDNELEDLRSKYHQLDAMRSEFQTNEANTRRKIDEMNRSRQAVLDRTRDEYEKLLRKYTELDETYRELASLKDKDTLEAKKIRSELQRLQNENIELTKQRETLHITHDVQMKKVHENHAAKLREAEQWPDRLQADLKCEREQHRAQMNDLERRMKEAFATDLNIEKQKYNGLLRKYEQECGSSAEQLRQELASTERVTIEQRNYYTKQIDQLEREKEDLKKQLNALRDVLKDLHNQLKKQESTNKERIDHLKLKEDLAEKETSLFHAQAEINELRTGLTQAKEEVITLQETVHKECTEREQLKEALIDARQQLLKLKKNGILNPPAARSLHSPPIAFEEIEKRVAAPLPYIQHDRPPFTQSEPTAYNHSIPDENAVAIDSTRPSENIQNRYKALPPIQSQRQKQRRNKYALASNKTEQLLQNQRRIVRFIKQMK